jgi:hypothetical protein
MLARHHWHADMVAEREPGAAARTRFRVMALTDGHQAAALRYTQ